MSGREQIPDDRAEDWHYPAMFAEMDMGKRFSDWLLSYEPIIRLLFRMAIIGALAAGVLRLNDVVADLGDISDNIAKLQAEIDSIRSDLQDQDDDTTSTGSVLGADSRI